MASRKPHARPGASVQPVTLRRGLVLGAFLAAWMLALAGRLYHLQIIQYVELVARAERQQQRTIEIAPTRGTIYDRRMQPLAMSLAVDSVFAVPSEIPNPGMVADLVAPVLGIEKGDLLARFRAFKSFCWVKRKVTAEDSARLRDCLARFDSLSAGMPKRWMNTGKRCSFRSRPASSRRFAALLRKPKRLWSTRN